MTSSIRRVLPGLRALTPARVALPTAGSAVATSEVLNFKLAHAQARDAVHAALDAAALAERLPSELPAIGGSRLSVLQLHSQAPDRATYLRHPDLGRRLDAASTALLKGGPFDLAVVIADGLSVLAVERNAPPVLAHLLPRLVEEHWTIAPIALVHQGRVAIGDPIGEAWRAQLSLVLIGERPGLSAADGLSAYITWSPRSGLTDADRNCISNIRAGGLSAEAAASRIHWYVRTARGRQLTGVALKEGAQELNATTGANLTG